MVGFLERDSKPPPHQLGCLGSAESSPAGFEAEAEPRPPKSFPLFSALRMTSPDTIILLIVDYHAAIGGGARPPCHHLAYAPVKPLCMGRESRMYLAQLAMNYVAKFV